jgi:esterase/lipase superfamily enzyme
MRLCAGLGLQTRAGAKIEDRTARRSALTVFFALCLATLAAGCSSRPYGNLIVGAGAPGASKVDMLVATTRAAVSEPPGVISAARAAAAWILQISLFRSRPTAHERPAMSSGPPRRPETRSGASSRFAPIALIWRRHARISMHGSPAPPVARSLSSSMATTPASRKAVYRFAQIVHDAHVDVAPVLFTWPSGGTAIDYVYDRDSAIYSRDALEAVLQALVKDPAVGSISILACASKT